MIMARRIEQYATGTLFVGLGLRVALTNKNIR